MSRIAVPYDDGRVFEHFGRTTRFLICDTDGREITCSNVVDVDTPGSGSGVADFLGRSHVDVVICTGIGEGARGHLHEYGVTVVTCNVGDAEHAVEEYLNGTLAEDRSLVHAEGGCRRDH